MLLTLPTPPIVINYVCCLAAWASVHLAAAATSNSHPPPPALCAAAAAASRPPPGRGPCYTCCRLHSSQHATTLSHCWTWTEACFIDCTMSVKHNKYLYVSTVVWTSKIQCQPNYGDLMYHCITYVLNKQWICIVVAKNILYERELNESWYTYCAFATDIHLFVLRLLASAGSLISFQFLLPLELFASKWIFHLA